MTALYIPQIRLYQAWLREHRGLSFADYEALRHWSVTDYGGFWRSLWEYDRFESPTPFTAVLEDERMPGARWFPGAQVNYALRVFRHVEAARAAGVPAIVSENELGEVRELSWPELKRQVASLALALRAHGVERGDRVAAYLPNVPETVVAFLACASIGAIWSVCAPDMGTRAVVDRFRQIEPRALIGADGVHYGGKRLDRAATLEALRAELPSVQTLVVMETPHALHRVVADLRFADAVARDDAVTAAFQPDWLPFDQPLWIVYSSGTTGLPKPIVHGHGGVLLIGAAGNKHIDLGPSHAPNNLGERFHWYSSTGSPLAEDVQRWGSRQFEQVGTPGIWWCNISGGTDFVGAFVTGHRELPQVPGRLQCRQLGSAVEAWNEAGEPVVDEVGELVCTRPLPSMPLYFWGDDHNARYLSSYFDVFPGVWRHGDWLKILPDGSCVIYGRSDATINRHGLRMGTSEIYAAVEAVPEVLDSLVIDLEYLGRESRLILFVVLRPGHVLDDALQARLREAVKTALSPRFLPDEIVQAPEIPRTLSGKKQEVPVKKLFLGHPVDKVVNRDAMANPQCIDWYVQQAAGR
jgi:acyl-coenzyme A synthetase/AMP-(fatty) acid ligase